VGARLASAVRRALGRRSVQGRRVFVEVRPKQSPRFLACIQEVLPILVAAHAEVREVVQEVTERDLAILGVLLRVEDVIVPERVNVLSRHDRKVRIDAVEVQKSLVPDLHLTRPLEGPSLALVRIHKLDHDGFQVELLNLSE